MPKKFKDYRQFDFDNYLHRTRRVPEASNFLSPVDTAAEFSRGSLSGQGLIPLTVDTNQMATDAITNPKMADNSVDTPELVDDAVTHIKMDDDSVGTDEVIDGSITKDKQTVGFEPNLIPEKYASFEYFNNGDDVGKIDGGAAACYTVLQSVDLSGNYFPSFNQRLARAVDETLWLVYVRSSRRYVYAAFSDDNGATWTHEQVADSGATNRVTCPCVAIDSDGTPHVGWVNSSSDRVFYSKRTGVDTWAAKATIANPSSTTSCAIAVDGNDDIHIAYNFATASLEDCRYRKYTSGAWQAEEVIYNGTVNHDMVDVAIDIDSNNIPHVAWSQQGTDATYWRQKIIKYANRVGGSWTVETVEDFNNSEATTWEGFRYADLIIDTDDKPHVIYKNEAAYVGGGDAHRLYYSWRDSAEADWQTNREAVYSGATALTGISLGMSQTNVAWVLYEQVDIFSTYRESASGDWATNLTNYTGGSYNNPSNPVIFGACYPKSGGVSVNKFASGYSLAFAEDPAAGNDMIIFCDVGSLFSSARASTADRYEGEKSLLLDLISGDNWYAGSSVTDYNCPVDAETEYIFSLYARAASGTVTVTLKAKQDDAVIKDIVATSVGTGWTRVWASFTTDAGVAEVLCRAVPDGSAYIDCLMLEKASSAATPEPSEWKTSSLVDRTLDDCSDVTIT